MILSRDETLSLSQAILDTLYTAGWLRHATVPPTPRPERPAPRYVRTLPGVTYDQRANVLKATLNYTKHGVKRSIYLANAAPTWANEVRLSRMWQAARAVYQAGGSEDAVKAAAQEVENETG